MRIYVASSWKNAEAAINVAHLLRVTGHDVDCFCDPKTHHDGKPRHVFSWADIDHAHELDGITAMDDKQVQRAFVEDKHWLDWADAVVLVLPCGNSAHLEAGYAAGKGKKLYILGKFPKGEFDVMYGFATGLYREAKKMLVDLRLADIKEETKP